MEYVDKATKEFDKYAKHFPEFEKICKQYGVPPGLVMAGGFAALIVIGVILQGYNIVCCLLTCVYPMLQSIKTIESDDSDETNMWLCFWTVYGLFQTFELFFGFVFYFIPYYSIMRLVFFMYLMLPQTQGAKTLYTTVFRPMLKKYSPQIKEFISKVSDKAGEMQKEGMSSASKMAKEMGSAENMAKAANLATQAQAKVNEVAGEGAAKKDD